MLYPFHACGSPPVIVTQYPHDGRNQQHTHNGGVQEEGDYHAEGNVFHHDDFGESEDARHHNHDGGCGGNDAAGGGRAEANRLLGTVSGGVRLHHAGDQEHFIVGR